MKNRGRCAINECDGIYKGLGYCKLHYYRYKKGAPLQSPKGLHENHGLTHHELYKTWANMKTRCYNKKIRQYKDYGGRGITVCDRWQQSFKSFVEDMGDKPTEQHTLDRINNDLGYSPENCRWADKATQNSNKRELNVTNKSGYKDISWYKRYNKWVVKIKSKHIGYFETIEEAIRVRDERLSRS